MTPLDMQKRNDTLRAVGALAPLIKALYDANEVTALNTLTNSIREALCPLLETTVEEVVDAQQAEASNPRKESDMDVIITLNGQRATGKTVLANKIVKLLRSEGFDVVNVDTDGRADVLRVLDPAKEFRDAPKATGKPTCDCPGCRMDRGEEVSDGERKAVELYYRMFETLANGRIFTIRN